MRICGIVAEYNPFHAGHARHIQLARSVSGADIIICAMSGSFVQRGEPAVFDKWTRTACALAAGADAVIELPLLSAVQSAESFAAGGVKLLSAAGATDLCFGCETDDIQMLTGIAQKMHEEDAPFRFELKKHLADGHSFAHARAAASDAPDETALPGAILGIEYIKAIIKHRLPVVAHAVKREGAAYHCDDISTHLPSATAIRRAFLNGQTEDAFAAMPAVCADILRTQMNAGLKPVFADMFDMALFHTLRLRGPAYIAQLPDVTEGLENRICSAAQSCNTRKELIERVKTRRYAYTRISRILLCALLGITRDMTAAHNAAPVEYIRVLGAQNAAVLSALSASAAVPVVTSASSPLYPSIDAAASDVWALSQNTVPFCAGGRDYTERLLV